MYVNVQLEDANAIIECNSVTLLVSNLYNLFLKDNELEKLYIMQTQFRKIIKAK